MRRQPSCDAWGLLVRFVLDQRGQFPAVAAELDLSAAQCHVLHLIDARRPVPMRRVAEALSCDASNVTGLVDRLERRGLVERRSSSADRRVKELRLTPAGARLRERLVGRISTVPDSFGRLSDADQRALVRILERLLG